jgi:hypothetical protein
MATLGGGRGSLLGGVSAEGCLLTDAELDVYVKAFRRTGTRGSFNWYRALDLNWEEERRIADPTIRVPTLMITAENDPILRLRRRDAEVDPPGRDRCSRRACRPDRAARPAGRR